MSHPSTSAPTSQQTQHTDPVELEREAHELATLAQSVPNDIDKLNQGLLPKDAADKLKRIEKLAKHLRGSFAP